MGGYAGYVWPAYGAGAVVLLLVLVLSLTSARKAEAELEVLQQARRGIRSRNGRGKDSENQE
ncbi:heme exporter protein CcmD [Magnetospirillum sp. 15-1]|uniref:heme exporter protein CcmD n=1 Tax=Magnetospirillum sp. 15-1 TaxID=1979370 RepID=UPI001F5B2AE2|nr:heme exporter protein CcmD [Magnetospirillum sp. 15-1]